MSLRMLLAATLPLASVGNTVTLEYFYPSSSCQPAAAVGLEGTWNTDTCYRMSRFVNPNAVVAYRAAENFGMQASCSNTEVSVSFYTTANLTALIDSSGTSYGEPTNCNETAPFKAQTGDTGSAALCVAFTYEVGQVTYYTGGSFSYRCSVTPCFSREVSTACRLSDSKISPTSAYDQCFGTAEETTASKVLMTELRAGDHVLTADTVSGAMLATRVIVNQHVVQPAGILSELLTVHYAKGSIALTPDHVISINGQMASAKTITPGSTLAMPNADGGFSNVVVEAVTKSTGGIINPLTTTGTILAAADGEPVLASAYPEWIAATFLGTRFYPLPISICNLISFLFPKLTQDFYDTYLEELFWQNINILQDAEKMAPSAVKTLIIAVLDVALAAGFTAYAVSTVLAPATALAVVAGMAYMQRMRK